MCRSCRGILAWLVTWYSTCLRNRPFFSGISSTWITSLAISLSRVCDIASGSSSAGCILKALRSFGSPSWGFGNSVVHKPLSFQAFLWRNQNMYILNNLNVLSMRDECSPLSHYCCTVCVRITRVFLLFIQANCLWQVVEACSYTWNNTEGL